MAVPGRRNGMLDEDEEEQDALFQEEKKKTTTNFWKPSPTPLRTSVTSPPPPSWATWTVDALRRALDNLSGNIDEPVEDGDTALHLACLYSYLPCVQLLLERGASLEVKDQDGAIPLHEDLRR